MNVPASPRLALAVGGVALGLLASTIAVPLMAPRVAAAGWSGSASVAVIDAFNLVGAIIVGTLIATRRPGNRYGWLLLSLGMVGALLHTTSTYATFALLVASGDVPLGWTAAWLASGLWMVLVVHLPFVLLLFPDGRLPSPRWRRLVWATLVAAVVALAALPFVPGQLGVVAVDNPNGLSGLIGTILQVVTGAATFGVLLAIPAAGVAVLIRWRRAGAHERLQLKWFLFAAALLGAEIVGTGAGAFVASDLVNAVLLALALNAVFVATGIAVTRYRLYDIDRVIRRTVTYAVVVVLLALVYSGTVVIGRASLRPLLGDSDLAVALSTLVVAALFQPLLRRVRAVVDRRFDRRRYDAARTVEAFGSRLRDAVVLDEVAADLRGVVAATMHPASLSLWLRPESGSPR